ncbi:MAG: GNAT family N-acetyltransferase [Pedobacter sp.]|nr:MAG: GNAT family N-acetyltransferase [Pedobacter sp.]
MIRPAKPGDADAVVPLIVLAMDELAAKFANSGDPKVIFELFKHFFQQNGNQYSYESTIVYVEEDKVLGALNAYDGGNLLELRKGFLEYLAEKHNLKNFEPEPETQSGEFYFDTLSVAPEAQGKGIGKALIKAGIDWASALGNKKVGLLVEKDNLIAQNLYKKSGFKKQNTQKFMGGDYDHLIYDI